MIPNLRLLLASTASLFACSTLVGADFDDRHQGDASAKGGVNATTGGTSPLGGQATGGTRPTGGAAQDGGSKTGGASSGGTANSGASSGGSTSGGTAGGGTVATNGGSAGTAHSGGSSGTVSTGGGTSGGTGGLSTGGRLGAAGDGGVGGDGGSIQGGAGGTPEAGAGGEAGGGSTSGPPVVVLNEVKAQGSGDDYIEIFNRGPGTLNLEGYGISDENNTFFFPAGAAIAQGGHVLLLLGQPNPPANSTFMCFTPSPCYHATWGVSQNGENVYLRGLQNQVLDTTAYPSQSGASAITNDQTWGRLPDGQGTFRATRPTPEALNQAP